MPEAEGDDWSASTSVADTGPDGEFDPDAREGIDSVLGFALPPPLEKPRRSRINIATAGLAALALVAAAFFAGVRVEKTHAKSSTGANLAAAFSRLGATSGARGAGSGTGLTGAGVTVGSVKLIDGTNIYVTTTSGAITKVIIGKASKVTVTKSGKVNDLKPGDSVVVQGAAAKDGSITATSLSDSGSASTGGAFGGFGGGFTPPAGGLPGGAGG